MTHMMNMTSVPQCEEIMRLASDVEMKIRLVEMKVAASESMFQIPGSPEAACFQMWCDSIGTPPFRVSADNVECDSYPSPLPTYVNAVRRQQMFCAFTTDKHTDVSF